MEITDIILICFAIFLYYVLTSKLTIEHLADPRKPEKCFYDPELIKLHGIFVSALEKDMAQLKKVKGKMLPSVCILDLVVNRRNGWEKFLEVQGNKYGMNSRQATLTKYLSDEYNRILDYTNNNGLEFLTKPYVIKVLKPVDPTTVSSGSNNPPEPVYEDVTVNILDELQKTLIKKIPTDI
jgi:hypothetical protein